MLVVVLSMVLAGTLAIGAVWFSGETQFGQLKSCFWASHTLRLVFLKLRQLERHLASTLPSILAWWSLLCKCLNQSSQLLLHRPQSKTKRDAFALFYLPPLTLVVLQREPIRKPTVKRDLHQSRAVVTHTVCHSFLKRPPPQVVSQTSAATDAESGTTLWSQRFPSHCSCSWRSDNNANKASDTTRRHTVGPVVLITRDTPRWTTLSGFHAAPDLVWRSD